ncbi:MAG: 5-formyltetrahydrofolate cyclo-ligase [Chloroflexales bacterium]|nr:5-formyltetrahydrofolate cyclo-ligase [Chloroflexales bacterium]
MSSPSTKQTLRRELIQRRDALDKRQERSAAICARIAAMAILDAADTLHCYLPIRSEVDTRPLIREALARGKGIVAPVVRRNVLELEHSWLTSLAEEDLEPGVLGTLRPRTLRPAKSDDWGLVIVPLLGFDRTGYRLGYGKGYYDRFLRISPAPTIGVAFAVQEIEAMPREGHDIPLDWIVTEDEIIRIDKSMRTRS